MQESAQIVGIVDSHYYKKTNHSPLRVFRVNAEAIEEELQNINTIDEALPVDVGDSVMYALDYKDTKSSEVGADIFLSFFFTEKNLVGTINLETFIDLDGDTTSPRVDHQKQQYWFTRILHERLGASETAVYPPHEEENPIVRFSESGEEKLIDELELRTGRSG